MSAFDEDRVQSMCQLYRGKNRILFEELPYMKGNAEDGVWISAIAEGGKHPTPVG
jgi:hypothetical protein